MNSMVFWRIFLVILCLGVLYVFGILLIYYSFQNCVSICSVWGVCVCMYVRVFACTTVCVFAESVCVCLCVHISSVYVFVCMCVFKCVCCTFYAFCFSIFSLFLHSTFTFLCSFYFPVYFLKKKSRSLALGEWGGQENRRGNEGKLPSNYMI